MHKIFSMYINVHEFEDRMRIRILELLLNSNRIFCKSNSTVISNM